MYLLQNSSLLWFTKVPFILVMWSPISKLMGFPGDCGVVSIPTVKFCAFDGPGTAYSSWDTLRLYDGFGTTPTGTTPTLLTASTSSKRFICKSKKTKNHDTLFWLYKIKCLVMCSGSFIRDGQRLFKSIRFTVMHASSISAISVDKWFLKLSLLIKVQNYCKISIWQVCTTR